MKTDLTNVLDIAIERLTAGEPIPAILADYPAQAAALQPLLSTTLALDTIRPVEIPSVEAWHADRNDFLANLADLPEQAVSPGPLFRLKEWIAHTFPWLSPNLAYQQKEHRRMSPMLIKAMIIFSLVFGSVGGTAVLAADSLPDSPVYPIKLTMEQVRLALTSGPLDQANLHLTLAQIRTQEMERLASRGEAPDEGTLNRLQQHLNQALHLAAQLPDEPMKGLLTRTQQMLQQQEQQLTQIQAQVGQPAQEALRQTSQFMNQIQQAVADGLADPLTFRHRYGYNRPEDAPVQPEPEPGLGQTAEPAQKPGPGAGPADNPNCPTGDCEPAADQNQFGQASDHIPGPHGDCDSGDCEPAGDEHKYGQDPDQEPGQYGDCDTNDCKRAGDEYKHQYGSSSDQPGQHGEPCNTGECEPDGDANHYGQEGEEPGGPHGDQDCTDDCDPAGNQNQHGSPAEPPPAPAPDQNDGDQGGQTESPAEPSPSTPPDQDHGDHGGQAEAPADSPDPSPPDQGGDDHGGGNSGGGNDSDNGGGSSGGGNGKK